MKIQINEVWNGGTYGSKELTILETYKNPRLAITQWISDNRPDLCLCTTIHSHGYHAIQIKGG